MVCRLASAVVLSWVRAMLGECLHLLGAFPLSCLTDVPRRLSASHEATWGREAGDVACRSDWLTEEAETLLSPEAQAACHGRALFGVEAWALVFLLIVVKYI